MKHGRTKAEKTQDRLSRTRDNADHDG
ncbi:MAG: DUF4169 family protein [Pseudomonadota bacterium]